MHKAVYQFTKEGIENLKKELETLVKRRPQVVINLSNAREQGDLSENAGYHAAKDELSQIDSRIRELKLLIRLAITPQKSTTKTVTFGTTVTVDDGTSKRKFTIVNALEADPKIGKMSDISPIGSALLNKKLGDTVIVETPNGQMTYKIVTFED